MLPTCLTEAYGLKLYELFASVDSLDVSNAEGASGERKLLDAYQSMSAASDRAQRKVYGWILSSIEEITP